MPMWRKALLGLTESSTSASAAVQAEVREEAAATAAANRKQGRGGGPVCFHCLQPGHKAKFCPDAKTPKAAVASSSMSETNGGKGAKKTFTISIDAGGHSSKNSKGTGGDDHISSSAADNEARGGGGLFCGLCNVLCSSQDDLAAHVGGKRHRGATAAASSARGEPASNILARVADGAGGVAGGRGGGKGNKKRKGKGAGKGGGAGSEGRGGSGGEQDLRALLLAKRGKKS